MEMEKADYAIETLKIEKYRLVAYHRQLRINEHEIQTSFREEIKEAEGKLEQLESAIKKIGGINVG